MTDNDNPIQREEETVTPATRNAPQPRQRSARVRPSKFVRGDDFEIKSGYGPFNQDPRFLRRQK